MSKPHFSTPPTAAMQPAETAWWLAENLGLLAVPAIGKSPVSEHNRMAFPFLDYDQLAHCWQVVQRRYPQRRLNITALTGARSELAVCDVDPRHGGSLDTLRAMGWPVDETVVVRTGGDPAGWHVWVKCPHEGLPNLSRYAPGIEFKADGLLVVVPWSIHPDTGVRYDYLPGQEPWNTTIARLPAAVLADIRARSPDPHSRGTPLDDEGDIPALAYTPEATIALVERLLTWAIRETAPERSDREHRNNMAFRLGLQLGSLGLANQEIAAVMALYEQAVRND